MKAILVLLDSLNRHLLSIYGSSWVRTPNIDRFASRSIVFDNHWVGSAPCMPARRDIMTGRLNFLEREWGGMEPFDVPFPAILREHGVFCHMETDHYHYFHVGGENYHIPFDTWSFHRGQERDAYASRVIDPLRPQHLGQWSGQYEKNRSLWTSDADFPTPRTFSGAVDWLRSNPGADDYFLWIEGLDPHEPFDCPEEFLDLYGDDWDGALYNWSGYEHVHTDAEATRHLRRRYAATLSMVDRWFGRLLDEIEQRGGMDDTLIILTTDHGHMLGEHGVTGKNLWHAWNEMTHIPLILHLPKDRGSGERRSQLTQNIDVMPTLLDYFGIHHENPIHGESWLPLVDDDECMGRRAALYGWYGQTVNVTDGRYTYFRAPASPHNQPLYRYFLTPCTYGLHSMCGEDFYLEAEIGKFLSYTHFPVIRARVHKPTGGAYSDSMLFNIVEDHAQTVDLVATEVEGVYEKLLVQTMQRMEAPDWQFDRLGLRRPYQ